MDPSTLTPNKKPTLDDVARLAGVAKSTASLVFAGDQAKRNVRPTRRAAVLEAARQLGFEVNPHARHLSSGGQRNTIAIFSIGLDLGVGTRKLDYVQSELSQLGFDVPIFSYGYSGAESKYHQGHLMNNLRRQQPRAIICTGHGYQSDAMAELRRYVEDGGVVVIYDHETDIDCDQVIFDRRHSTYTAVRHLCELGHRRIALVSEGRPPEDERTQGFHEALAEFGVHASDALQFVTAREEDGGLELAEKYHRFSNPPTGLAIINDRSASAFVNALMRDGIRVPEQVSVICHDNLPTARACVVPLTAMAQPMQEIASCVARLLVSRLDGTYEGPARREVVRGQLIERESTASLASAAESTESFPA